MDADEAVSLWRFEGNPKWLVIFMADAHQEPNEGLWFGLPPEPLLSSQCPI